MSEAYKFNALTLFAIPQRKNTKSIAKTIKANKYRWASQWVNWNVHENSAADANNKF